MARRVARWLAILGALAGTPCAGQPATLEAAPAQGTPAPSDSTIVVTGEAPAPVTSSEVYDQALEVTRIDPRQTYMQALPRFEMPLCPGVFGLRDDYAQEIVARIRANAAGLKVKLAARGCSPNLLVAFQDDSRAFLSDLAQQQPRIFELVSAPERTELLDQPSPVRVFSLIVKRWTGSGSPPDGWPKQRPSVWGQVSRLALPEANDINLALVVFDREAVVGLSLTQLADYATMRGLSHTRPIDDAQPMSTILALFADDSREPDQLTTFDRSYLRSLYFEAANQSAQSKLLGVRRRTRQFGG